MVSLKPLDLAQHGPIIAVIQIDELAHAVPMAQALVAGGVRVLEITLRTSVALAAIETIRHHVPQAIVGTGTVRTVQEVTLAEKVGSQFIVSPGYSSAIGQACQDRQMALLPGVATASEIMQACADGFHFLKFFPAVATGGTALLKAWSGPFPDVHFCPTGGITPDNATQFLNLPNVRVCGSSWLTPKALMQAQNWQRITELATQASALQRIKT
jgi:2-dehydro-3-deoxyphosphogluconate aldolase / (4S)-4-hydroxy-2-oxoglutarate aldolase